MFQHCALWQQSYQENQHLSWVKRKHQVFSAPTESLSTERKLTLISTKSAQNVSETGNQVMVTWSFRHLMNEKQDWKLTGNGVNPSRCELHVIALLCTRNTYLKVSACFYGLWIHSAQAASSFMHHDLISQFCIVICISPILQHFQTVNWI